MYVSYCLGQAVLYSHYELVLTDAEWLITRLKSGLVPDPVGEIFGTGPLITTTRNPFYDPPCCVCVCVCDVCVWCVCVYVCACMCMCVCVLTEKVADPACTNAKSFCSSLCTRLTSIVAGLSELVQTPMAVGSNTTGLLKVSGVN